jgi:hypothetical protein
VANRKLRIYTRLQLLAKWNPKRYGDRVEVEHQGEQRHTITFKG